ncbi:MAG: hypothetical protein ACREEO_08165, partial [Phenylobacterium sp.]
MINDDGGTKRPRDFTLHVEAAYASPAWFAGSASGTTVTLHAGRYRVDATGPDGYEERSS